MSETKNKIAELIRADRPNITDSSVKQYLVNYKKIKQLLNTNDDNLTKLNDTDYLLGKIDEINKMTTKKNLITTILVLGRANKTMDKSILDIYTNKLKSFNDEYKKEQDKQELTPSQKELWVEYDVIVKLSNDLLNQVNKFKNKKVLDENEMRTLMDLVIIRSYIISPARNAYADMKVAEEESDITKKHNYILLNEYGTPIEFVFNVFKNVKTLGQRRVKIDGETAKIIKLWLKHNTTGDYLITLNDDPMTSQYLSHYLMSMFKKYINKPISSSMLRHIMISHDLRNTPTIKENEQKSVDVMNKYQHSTGMNQLYRKIR